MDSIGAQTHRRTRVHGRGRSAAPASPSRRRRFVRQAPEVVDQFVTSYLSGNTDAIEVMYTRFFSFSRNTAATRSLLPFEPHEATHDMDEVWHLHSKEGKFAVTTQPEPEHHSPKYVDYNLAFDQEPEEIMDQMIPLYLNSQVCLGFPINQPVIGFVVHAPRGLSTGH